MVDCCCGQPRLGVRDGGAEQLGGDAAMGAPGRTQAGAKPKLPKLDGTRLGKLPAGARAQRAVQSGCTQTMLTARHTPCAAAGARAAAQPNAQACAARPQPRRPVGAASAQGAAASAFMGGAGGASGVAAASGRRRGSSSSRGNLQVVNVIPMIQGDASQQLPPDLPSYLFKERIVYMVRSPRLCRHTSPRVAAVI